jgi:predicted branched-subunit amino acid permease
MEKKVPVPKTIARDFILGAVLLLLIMQLLPESTQKLIGYVTALAAVPAASAVAAATEAISEVAAAVPAVAALTDGAPEVKVGVPRF